jgi:peptide/nickel transport system ATP-binding protein
MATVEKFIETTGSAALIITHDLKFAKAVCDEIAVMYAGEIVETGKTAELFDAPKHPYLKALIAAQPEAGLRVLKGTACSLLDLPPGCRFYERCPLAANGCRETHPDLIRLSMTREARCLNLD